MHFQAIKIILYLLNINYETSKPKLITLDGAGSGIMWSIECEDPKKTHVYGRRPPKGGLNAGCNSDKRVANH